MSAMRIRFILLLLFAAAAARADFRQFCDIAKDPQIETALRHAADAALKEFPKLASESLAISVVDVTRSELLARGDYHGDDPFYPASVIKLFFMAETFHQQKEKEPDVGHALNEMIRVSDNDATAFILDTISDTCSGPVLDGRALAKFIDKRRVVNKWLQPMGYDFSAMSKPWSFGPFGRDVQVLGEKKENRNRASANAVASLLLWIARGRAVSKEASAAMMALLERPLNAPREGENQVKEFIGEALPPAARLWSKAGWTTAVRHDAAYIEMPGGKKLVLVIFTAGPADDVKLLPAIAKHVLDELGAH
jgi:beta-lactamase class A